MKEETFELIARASFSYMFEPDGRSPNSPVGPSVMFSSVHAADLVRDKRFVGLCAKLGLCDYWVTTGRWPDCAGEGLLPKALQPLMRGIEKAMNEEKDGHLFRGGGA
jgi:hypothetical protein